MHIRRALITESDDGYDKDRKNVGTSHALLAD